jgi:hypothetical protein
MRIELTREILPLEEKDYIEVLFTVPEGIERLKVSCRLREEQGGQHVIDLGVRDSTRVRGWSGGARAFFEIGPEHATPGYIPGAIGAGEWAVLLGAYRIGSSGCKVELTVTLEEETDRWLRGELHAHTTHSDGAFTLEEAVRLAEQAGLDFLALTDHNTVSQNLTRPRAGVGPVLIPAMELTTNYGHCNFYGIDVPVDDFRAVHPEQAAQLLRTAKERGAYVSLNHPHCSQCGWLWGFDVGHDWVEIWNGPWREDNQRTLDWWQGELASGRRLTAVGGSDFHREHQDQPFIRHGMPCNWVLAGSRSVQGILKAVDQGRVTLSYAPEGPRLVLSAGSCRMGDTAPWQEAAALGLELCISGGLEKSDVIRLYSGQGLEKEWTAGASHEGGLLSAEEAAGVKPGTMAGPVNGEIRMRLPVHSSPEAKLFYRVELWRCFEEAGTTSLQLAAATNPVYIR